MYTHVPAKVCVHVSEILYVFWCHGGDERAPGLFRQGHEAALLRQIHVVEVQVFVLHFHLREISLGLLLANEMACERLKTTWISAPCFPFHVGVSLYNAVQQQYL